MLTRASLCVREEVEEPEMPLIETVDDSLYYGSRYLYNRYDYNLQRYSYQNRGGNSVIVPDGDYYLEEDEFHGRQALVSQGDWGEEVYAYMNMEGKLETNFRWVLIFHFLRF